MKILKKLLSSDYGMLGVLVVLCVFFSLITFENQQPVGRDAADRLLVQIQNQFETPGVAVLAGKGSDDGRDFVSQLEEQLIQEGWKVEAKIAGSPIDLGKALRQAGENKLRVILLACEQSFADSPLVENLKTTSPGLSQMKVLSPDSYGWPNFLKTSNLLNIANQIAVIAIIAILVAILLPAVQHRSFGRQPDCFFRSHLLLADSGMYGWTGGNNLGNGGRQFACVNGLRGTGFVFRIDDCLFWGSFVCGKFGHDDGGERAGLYDFRRAFDLPDTVFL